MHPAAGNHVTQRLPLRLPRQRVAERGQLQQRVTCQRRVQALQKIVTIERIVFPGVFAIERDERHRTRLAGLPGRHALEFADKVAHGIVAMPALVGEADQIRQLIVAEAEAQCATRNLPGTQFGRRVGALATSALGVSAQAAAQHVAAAGGPARAVHFEQCKRTRADRAFRWPAAGGRAAEHAAEYTQALFHVPGGALFATRILRGVRKRCVGNRFARRVEVDQQRQDRVRVGRHRKLDLTALGECTVPSQESGQQIADQPQQHAPMRGSEIARVLDERGHARITPLDGLAQPGDVVPDTDIMQVLI